MIISYQGAQSFKVQFGDTVLAFDPISKDSRLIGGQAKLKASSFGADVALISLNHPDMNGAAQASRGEKEAFVVSGPGEYEIKGIFIKGLPSVSRYGGEEKINTIYTVNLENINLCFLGALSDINLSSATKEAIDGVDILFVPVGGASGDDKSNPGILSAGEAYKLAVSLEPSIIIPMNYTESSLKAFMKEGGGESVKPIEKLTIKKKDLEGKESEIVVLDTQ
jgi:L-ascorbate metabolism protein UlaG (beta-lactamase superfamily)